MAESPARRLDRHLRDPAPLDPDRRQGAARAESLAEPLVARDAVRDGDAASPRRSFPTEPARSRSISTSSSISSWFGRATAAAPGSRSSRNPWRPSTGGSWKSWSARAARDDQRAPQRDSRRDPLRCGRGPPRIRSRLRQSLLAHPRAAAIASSANSARASSASAAPCTSSGAPRIWPSRASPAARRRVHPGGVPNLPDWVAREAYSHEVSSCGFWPGGGPIPHAAFYSYAYPEPAGFAAARVAPRAPSTARTSASSSCRTTSSASRPLPTTRCSRSCNRRTRPPPISRSGIAARSNASATRARARRALCRSSREGSAVAPLEGPGRHCRTADCRFFRGVEVAP